MASVKELTRRINEKKENMQDIQLQVTEYLKSRHLVNMTMINFMGEFVQNQSDFDAVCMEEYCSNTENIVKEIRLFIAAYQIMRKYQAQLKLRQKKGGVKKRRVQKRQKKLKKEARKATNPFIVEEAIDAGDDYENGNSQSIESITFSQ